MTRQGDVTTRELPFRRFEHLWSGAKRHLDEIGR